MRINSGISASNRIRKKRKAATVVYLQAEGRMKAARRGSFPGGLLSVALSVWAARCFFGGSVVCRLRAHI